MDEPTTDILKLLDTKITPSKGISHLSDSLDVKGDWIDGLIVGFDMIYNKIGKLKYH